MHWELKGRSHIRCALLRSTSKYARSIFTSATQQRAAQRMRERPIESRGLACPARLEVREQQALSAGVATGKLREKCRDYLSANYCCCSPYNHSLRITNRSFQYASPRCWNQLPTYRRSLLSFVAVFALVSVLQI